MTQLIGIYAEQILSTALELGQRRLTGIRDYVGAVEDATDAIQVDQGVRPECWRRHSHGAVWCRSLGGKISLSKPDKIVEAWHMRRGLAKMMLEESRMEPGALMFSSATVLPRHISSYFIIFLSNSK